MSDGKKCVPIHASRPRVQSVWPGRVRLHGLGIGCMVVVTRTNEKRETN